MVMEYNRLKMILMYQQKKVINNIHHLKVLNVFVLSLSYYVTKNSLSVGRKIRTRIKEMKTATYVDIAI